jgi:hypothetical protein
MACETYGDSVGDVGDASGGEDVGVHDVAHFKSEGEEGKRLLGGLVEPEA